MLHRRGGCDTHRGRRAALVGVDGSGVPGAGVATLLVQHLQAVLDEPAHLLGRLEPVVRVLGERAHDEAVQLRRHLVQDLGRQHGGVLDMLVDHGQRGLTGERRAQREKFVEQAADGVQVGAVVDGLAEGLLGREVLRGAHDHAGLRHGRLRAVQGARDAEVHHLHRAGVGDDHVRGLDVAVHDAVLVRVGERFQDTRDDDQGLFGTRRLRAEQEVADGAALDQLHDDVRDGAAGDDVLAGVVDRHDRMVVEPRDRLCLAGEAGLGDRVLGEIGTEQLDGDRAPEAYVLGREDLRHATPAESAGQSIPTVPDEPAVTPHLRRI